MTVEERVLIAGAGPVGIAAAANLVRHGVPVTVLEAGATLSEESRASTFHPPTLDMLDRARRRRAADRARPDRAAVPVPHQAARPDRAVRLRRHRRRDRRIRTGCSASSRRLTRILYEQLREQPNFETVLRQPGAGRHADMRRRRRGRGRAQRPHRDAVRPLADRRRRRAQRRARDALGIEFEGFTWPERFLVVSTPFDFARRDRGSRAR